MDRTDKTESKKAPKRKKLLRALISTLFALWVAAEPISGLISTIKALHGDPEPWIYIEHLYVLFCLLL